MTSSQRANVYTYLNTLLSQGQPERAIAYARKQQVIEPGHGLPEIHTWLKALDEERAQRKRDHEANTAAREADEYRRSKECAEAEVILVPMEPVQALDGWPAEGEAEVWARCKNPRLVVIQFADGRQASMWKGPINHKVGSKVHVRMADFRGGDPVYERISA